MAFPIPHPARTKAPDGPDSSLASLRSAAGRDAASGDGARGRAARRLDPLPAGDFVAALDARPRGRIGGALVILRLRRPGEAALLALAEASSRAVRPGDTVGRIGGGTVAIWLDGLPHALAEARAERLRLSLQRQGLRELDLAALPVRPGDTRSAATLLFAAMDGVGGQEQAES